MSQIITRGHKLSHMVINHQHGHKVGHIFTWKASHYHKLSYMVTNYHIIMVTNNHTWSQIVIHGHKLSHMVTHCRPLSQIVAHCHKLAHMISNCRSLSQVFKHCHIIIVILGHKMSLLITIFFSIRFLLGHDHTFYCPVADSWSLSHTLWD